MTEMLPHRSLDQDAIAATLIEQIKVMTEDWFDGDDVEILADTPLVKELGLTSMDFVMLVVDIQQKFQRRDIPFDDLFAPNGHYVADLTVSQIARFLSSHLDT